jgi:hypothetical protein
MRASLDRFDIQCGSGKKKQAYDPILGMRAINRFCPIKVTPVDKPTFFDFFVVSSSRRDKLVPSCASTSEDMQMGPIYVHFTGTFFKSRPDVKPQ